MSIDQTVPGSQVRRWLFGVLLLLACVGFIALGNWQLRRLSWKLELITRVDARLKAAPTTAPGRSEWPQIDADRDEYRRICTDGSLLNEQEALVQAVTRLGRGDWVLTPLRQNDGTIIFINRGFVDPDHRSPLAHPASSDPIHVCGLLRMSEPRGAFLHRNNPAQDRWYSRDVAAIAAARRLDAASVAPYFIDEDAGSTFQGWPVGGLTVVHFRNSHLSYALTWYGLALLSAAGLVLLIHHERRARVQSL